MTMTLDEVRKTRFHMSRRNGYEVTDVDIFVDKVEETIGVLTEENEALKRRVKDKGAPTAGGGESSQEVENLRYQITRFQEERNTTKTKMTRLQAELEQARSASAPRSGPGNDQALVRELEQLRGQLAQVNAQLIEAKGQANEYRTQLGEAKGHLVEAKTRLIDSQKAGAGQEQVMRLTGENHQLREQLERLMMVDKQPVGMDPIAVTTSPEASTAVVRLVQLATEQADNLVSEATAEATRRKAAVEEEIRAVKNQADSYVARVKNEADAHVAQVKSEAQFSAEEMLRKATDSASQINGDAQERADRIDREARTNAERLVQEAQQRAITIDSEISARRSEVFGALEHERDLLFAKVEKLRTYEKSFRQTMTGYLKSQIERLDSSQFAPEEIPDLLQTPARTANDWSGESASATPRLDALLDA
ncbi:MAG: DivIVA domain-containing protein [Propionibacteriaceae bacterium]|jgi:DivIVA domain-containing protein|nr:DivIVA domain-containing protein [Propionibacteriaceae bacterium]